MKRTVLLIVTATMSLSSIAQQIPLKGIVSVQNSKTYTGKTQYVKNVEVKHPKAKSEVTDDDGKFTLIITGEKSNTQTQIAITLYGEYTDYVVVNEKELRDITLGRLTPVSAYICKKKELEQRQAEMVGINMRKLEERMEADKKRLQKELEELKAKNDYLSSRYGQIKDSLDIISKSIDNAFERIKEYAQNMVLENLDDRDENYVKAYNCFSRGELDSVSYYLSENELELRYKKVLQMQEEAKKEKELAAILTETAKAKEEFSENSLNELIKEWLLLARTYDMKNDYEKAKTYYEKAINADTTSAKNIFEFANYLHKIKEYANAEKYYKQCLEIYLALEKENPKAYLSYVATALNNLAVIHKTINEYPKALKEYEEALEIRRKLAKEDHKTYLPDVAITLNNLANLHSDINEYPKALEELEEALKIYREVVVENPKTYLYYVATTLNNLAIIHKTINESPKALKEYEEALEIRRKLAEENSKMYLPDVATTLNNLANLHSDINEYPKALKEFEEVLKIRRTLAEENPKAYLPNVATTLNNLGNLHSNIKEYSKALEEFEEALKIRREFAAENPKAYLPDVAMILNNLGNLHKTTNKYKEALEKYDEALKIYRKLADETPKAYSHYVAATLNNLANLHSVIKEYPKALEEYEEALKIYKKLADETPKMYLSRVIATLNILSYTHSQMKDFPSAIKYTNSCNDLLLEYQKQINYKPALAKNYSTLSWYYLFTKEYDKSEQSARQALELDSASLAITNLAHALLFQNNFLEAEEIYKKLSQTVYKENKTYTQTLLEDLGTLEKEAGISEEHKGDVEKIREMLKQEQNDK